MELKLKSASLMTILALSTAGCGTVESEESQNEKHKETVLNVENLKKEGIVSTDKESLGRNRAICYSGL